MKAYIGKQDNKLPGQSDKLDEESAAQSRHWIEVNLKAKIAIALTLSDRPLAHLSDMIEEGTNQGQEPLF